jgi:transposase-like protein
MPDNASSHKPSHRYPPELRERAVRMVFEIIEQTGERTGAVARMVRSLRIGIGIGVESLRNWVRQVLRSMSSVSRDAKKLSGRAS